MKRATILAALMASTMFAGAALLCGIGLYHVGGPAALVSEPLTLRGFHEWEVVYLSTVGDVVLAPGYESPERIPVADFLAAHPEAAVR